VRTFRWLPTGTIPYPCDLRRCGWRLVAGPGASQFDLPASMSQAPISLAHVALIEAAGWIDLLGQSGNNARREVVLLGVTSAEERARLLGLGFGDVLDQPALAELDARALRASRQRDWVPARRRVGRLNLELEARDGFVARRALGLHPREFALLWRLAANPGCTVAKCVLIGDVWRLDFVPETNSLAVHIFRLRAKLADAGLGGTVVTDADGGYRLVEPLAWNENAQMRHEQMV
jgi:two-component system, OmpR family, response regulator